MVSMHTADTCFMCIKAWAGITQSDSFNGSVGVEFDIFVLPVSMVSREIKELA